MITHLHTHSYYSFLEGTASPKELAQRARQSGMQALALTDHLNLTGAVEFYLACQSEGIKPILGLEIDVIYRGNSIVGETGSLVLLAMDSEGWTSLCRLSSYLHLGENLPAEMVCSVDQIAVFTNHIICMSGGNSGLLEKMMRRNDKPLAVRFLSELKDLFPDRLYVELQVDEKVKSTPIYEVTRLAQQLSLPVIASHDVHFLDRIHSHLFQTLTAIRLNVPIDRIPADSEISEDHSFITEDEFETRFTHLPSSISNIQTVVDRCNLILPIGTTNFPKLLLPEGQSEQMVLRQKALAGAERLYGKLSPEINNRLEHELEIIAGSGYESIFLIMEELLGFARKSDILFSSRGSAASSLVAHCLGITSPDPLDLDLYFERFLNPARTTPPDIDTDICSRNRDMIIQHVFDVYGPDRVAMVGTINTYRSRSALADVAKAHGMPQVEIRKLVNTLPYFSRRPDDDEENPPNSPYSDLMAAYTSPLHRRVFGEATTILRFPRHLSMHAGGIVVSPGLMTDLVPTQLSGHKGVVITQFDLVSLEHLGLVKIDLLGIRGLTVVSDVTDAIRTSEIPAHSSRFELLESIPLQDLPTSDRIEKGLTVGCFQIESPGMRRTLKEINARTIDDIMAALALYRPGPLKGGYKDAFIRRHKGEEPSQFFHPSLAGLLRDTYGVIVYQEQVLRIAHELAGLSIADSDLLRRAMSHFDPGKQLQAIKERFIQGAWEKSHAERSLAEQVWDLMAAFAGYGFPKAHAASYAMFSWRSAWCKTHFPAEFMAAVLANWGGYYSQQVYLTEAKRLGIEVHAPHINHSQREFSVSHIDGKSVLYMGLDQVSELTHRTQQRIIMERPFSSLVDFLTRVDPRPKEAENLIRAGGFAGLSPIPTLLDSIKGLSWKPGQLSLFEPYQPVIEDWSIEEKVSAQREILGIGVEAHPLELVLSKMRDESLVTTNDVSEKLGERVRIVGIKQGWHRSFTSEKGTIAFFTLEDLEGMVDVTVPPAVYRKYKNVLFETSPILVDGVIETSATRPEPVIRAENLIAVIKGDSYVRKYTRSR